MKNIKTESKEKIALAVELAEILSQKTILEAREQELKNYFKAELDGKAGVIEAGSVVIVVDSKNRSSLDKKLLEAKFGSLTDYEKVTAFLSVSVRRLS